MVDVPMILGTKGVFMKTREFLYEGIGLLQSLGRMSLREIPNPAQGPIVFVSGGYIPAPIPVRVEGVLHRSYYTRLANHLRLSGFRVLVSRVGVSRRHIHETMLLQLEEIEAFFGSGVKIHGYYGHSLGGVPGFDHLISHPERVENLIVSGTPNQGTPITWLGEMARRDTGACREMYEEYREDIAQVSEKIWVLRSRGDSVSPPWSSRIDGTDMTESRAHHLTLGEGIFHGTITTSLEVFEIITSILLGKGGKT